MAHSVRMDRGRVPALEKELVPATGKDSALVLERVPEPGQAMELVQGSALDQELESDWVRESAQDWALGRVPAPVPESAEDWERDPGPGASPEVVVVAREEVELNQSDE